MNRWIKENRGSFMLVALSATCLAMVWILYRLFGRAFVGAMYHGKSLPQLNAIISGQDVHPLEFYLEMLEPHFFKLFFLGGMVVFLEVVFLGLKTAGRSEGIRRLVTRHKSMIGGAVCFLAVSFSVCFLSAIWYEKYVKGLSGYERITSPSYKEREFPSVTDWQLVNLGWVQPRKAYHASAYPHFPEVKRPGTVRIGIFGGSFVEGYETAKGHDFPSFLQAKFHASELDHVEVINFGVGGYGVHQSYLLWEYAGQKYDLDYVVFFPFKFHLERDKTFDVRPSHFGSIHAIYVVENNDLELLEVFGKSRREAIEIYHKIVPRWRYLRYDERPPPFLRALLPAGRKLRFNPFYYRLKSGKQEIPETYALLFNRLAENVENLIIVVNEDFLYGLKDAVSSPNVSFLKSPMREYLKERSFHIAPMGHLSAFGNKMRAGELFSFLTGKEKAEFSYLKVSDAPERKPGAAVVTSEPLFRYADASITLSDGEVASFVRHAKGTPKHHFDEKVDFSQDGVWSLLQARGWKGKRLKFIPVSFSLKDREVVFVAFRRNDRLVKVPIGTIEATSSVMGRVALSPVDEDGHVVQKGADWLLEIGNGDYLKGVVIEGDSAIEDVHIALGDQPILVAVEERGKGMFGFLRKESEGKKFRLRRKLSFQPVLGGVISLRSSEGQFVDTDALVKKRGALELALTRQDGSKVLTPTLLEYQIVSPNPEPFSESLRNFISVD